MSEALWVLVVILACVGGLYNAAQWAGLLGPREIANRFMLCETCLGDIRPGDRIRQDSDGAVRHVNCL